MKRKGRMLFVCIALCVVCAGGCSSPSAEVRESEAPASAGESREVSEESSVAESSQAESAQDSVFVQMDSGAEAGYEPTLMLASDGSFNFSVNLYDGMVSLSGKYEQLNGEYRLTVTGSTAAEGTPAASITDFKFTEEAAGELVYSGEQLGLTPNGSKFVKGSE